MNPGEQLGAVDTSLEPKIKEINEKEKRAKEIIFKFLEHYRTHYKGLYIQIIDDLELFIKNGEEISSNVREMIEGELHKDKFLGENYSLNLTKKLAEEIYTKFEGKILE